MQEVVLRTTTGREFRAQVSQVDKFPPRATRKNGGEDDNVDWGPLFRRVKPGTVQRVVFEDVRIAERCRIRFSLRGAKARRRGLEVFVRVPERIVNATVCSGTLEATDVSS